MKVLGIKTSDSSDIFEIHEFEDLKAFNNHIESKKNIKNIWKKKALLLLLLFVMFGYFFYVSLFFSDIFIKITFGFFFIFYVVYIIIFLSSYSEDDYIFILDKEKKEFIIEGNREILLRNSLIQELNYEDLKKTDDYKLKLPINQTLKFELLKKEDSFELEEKYDLHYDKDFVDRVMYYKFILCLRSRDYKGNGIELFRSKSFTESSPLKDEIIERWKNVTEKLNRFLNS